MILRRMIYRAYPLFQDFPIEKVVGLNGAITGTKSIKQQENRLKDQLQLWNKIDEENREQIIMGDMNVDSIAWDKPNNKLTNHQTKQKGLSKLIKE